MGALAAVEKYKLANMLSSPVCVSPHSWSNSCVPRNEDSLAALDQPEAIARMVRRRITIRPPSHRRPQSLARSQSATETPAQSGGIAAPWSESAHGVAVC